MCIRDRPESEHFVFENHHEARVSKETFQSANDIRNRRATMNRQCGKPKRNYFFGGLCRCAEMCIRDSYYTNLVKTYGKDGKLNTKWILGMVIIKDGEISTYTGVTNEYYL